MNRANVSMEPDLPPPPQPPRKQKPLIKKVNIIPTANNAEENPEDGKRYLKETKSVKLKVVPAKQVMQTVTPSGGAPSSQGQ